MKNYGQDRQEKTQTSKETIMSHFRPVHQDSAEVFRRIYVT